MRLRGAIAAAWLVAVLLAPATASYHFVLLWLPVGLLIHFSLREGAPVRAGLILVLYSLIGFFPYGYVARFAGQGHARLFAWLASSTPST